MVSEICTSLVFGKDLKYFAITVKLIDYNFSEQINGEPSKCEYSPFMGIG
jgi:hypothetical protein